jgi:hypothetical protein
LMSDSVTLVIEISDPPAHVSNSVRNH